MKEGFQKVYVTDPGYLEFGHLLCGKTRDRYHNSDNPPFCYCGSKCFNVFMSGFVI